MDLCVSEELFETLKEKYNLKDEDKNECGFYHITDMIEVVSNKKEDFNCEEIDRYYVEDLEQILAFKKKRSAPKDIPYIEKIEQYLKSKETAHE